MCWIRSVSNRSGQLTMRQQPCLRVFCPPVTVLVVIKGSHWNRLHSLLHKYMHISVYSSAISWLNRSRNICELYKWDFNVSTGNQHLVLALWTKGLVPKCKNRGSHLQRFYAWLHFWPKTHTKAVYSESVKKILQEELAGVLHNWVQEWEGAV